MGQGGGVDWASGCTGLQQEYWMRHDRMGLRVYWVLCQKYRVNSVLMSGKGGSRSGEGGS